MKKTLLLPLIIVSIFLLSSCFLFKPNIEKVNGPSSNISQNEATFIWKGSRLLGSLDGYAYKKDDGNWKSTNQTSFTWTDISEGFHSFSVKGKYGSGKETEVTRWHFQYKPDTRSVTVKASPFTGGDIKILNTSGWSDEETVTVENGTTLSVEAQADGNYQFDGWFINNERKEKNLQYSLIIQEDMIVEARFSEMAPPWMSFEDIKEASFKTGSLIYSSDNKYSQLESGQVIKIKLFNPNNGQEKLQEIFSAMKLNSINTNSISFDYLVYDKEGNLIINQSNLLVATNGSFDLNQDGLTDLEYKTLDRANLRNKESIAQRGNSNMRLLEFTNDVNKENLVLFSYKDSGTNIDKENGLINVNHEGELIVSSLYYNYRETHLSTETHISFYTPLPNLVKGDIIIDMKYGVMREIKTVTESIGYNTYETEFISLPDAFGTIIIDFKGNPMAYQIENLRNEIEPRDTKIKKLLDETFRIFEKKNGTNFIIVDTNFNMTLEMETHVATSTEGWVFKRVDIDSIYMKIDFSVGNTATLTAHWDEKFHRKDDYKLVEPKFYFAIGPVPCNIAIPMTVGYETDFKANLDTLLAYEFKPGFNAVLRRGDGAADWSFDGGGFYPEKGWTSTELEVDGEAYIRPFFNVRTKFELLNGLVFMGVGVEPYVKFGVKGEISSSLDSRFKAYVNPGLRVEAGAGFDAWIFKGEKWFEILNPSIDLWNLVIAKPAKPGDFVADYIKSNDKIETTWKDNSGIETGYEILHIKSNGQQVSELLDANQEHKDYYNPREGENRFKLRSFYDCTGIDLRTYSGWVEDEVTVSEEPEKHRVTVQSYPQEGGKISVNNSPWSTYEDFEVEDGTTILLNARANNDYVFDYWGETSSERNIKRETEGYYDVYRDIDIVAVFVYEKPKIELIKVKGPDNGETINEDSAAFEWNLKDPSQAGNVIKYQIKKDSRSWTDNTPSLNNTFTWNHLTEGPHTFRVRLLDTSGVYTGTIIWNFTYTKQHEQAGELKWKFKADFWFSKSNPAIGSDGTIYVGSLDDNLYAINPDGSLKWKFETGDDIESSPAIGSNGTIYVGSFDKKLYAINPDGTKKWEFATENIICSSPAIGNNETIYIVSKDGNLYAINSDGSKKWKYNLKAWQFSTPSIGSDGTIYVGSNDMHLYAINSDGTLKWKYLANYLIGGVAIANDGTIYFGSLGKLYAINSYGIKKWEFYTGSINNISWNQPSIAKDGTVYFAVGESYGSGALYAVNPNGTKKWEFKTKFIYSCPAIGKDGTIYFGTRDKKFYAVKSDGVKKWEYTTLKNINMSPAIGKDGTVYFGPYNEFFYALYGNSGGLMNSAWPKFGQNEYNTSLAQ